MSLHETGRNPEQEILCQPNEKDSLLVAEVLLHELAHGVGVHITKLLGIIYGDV